MVGSLIAPIHPVAVISIQAGTRIVLQRLRRGRSALGYNYLYRDVKSATVVSHPATDFDGSLDSV